MLEIPEQAASLHMSSVILWANGLVTVFDEQGQQMPEFQGQFHAVRTQINVVFSGNWEYADWRRGIIQWEPLS